MRNLEISELAPMLASGDIDLAITIPEFTDPGLHTEFLYREQYACVVRDAHPIRSKHVSMKRFLSFDHVLVSPSDGRFSGPADDALAALGEKRRVAISVPGFHVMMALLESDDLIGFLPRRLLGSRQHTLREVTPPIEVPGLVVLADWHSRTHYDVAQRWLRHELGAVARSLS